VGSCVRTVGSDACRTEASRREKIAEARRLDQYGIDYAVLTGAQLRELEPHVSEKIVGAIHFRGSPTPSDPGSEAVVALGPWSDDVFRPLGYDIRLATKRGYHMHYGVQGNAALGHPLHDADGGYVLVPMRKGIRLTTGVEFAERDAPPTPIQLARDEPLARELFPLGERLEAAPWLGRRPCLPDMVPVIGRGDRHRGLWFAFGHAHHGFTLGSVSGRLLAEMMTGETPFTDPSPYAAARFFALSVASGPDRHPNFISIRAAQDGYLVAYKDIASASASRAPGSGQPGLNLIRMGAPESRPNSLRCRLIKLDHAGEAGATPHCPAGTGQPTTAMSHRGNSAAGSSLESCSSARARKIRRGSLCGWRFRRGLTITRCHPVGWLPPHASERLCYYFHLKEVQKDRTVEVTIPVEPAAAAELGAARNREAMRRLISRVLRPRLGPPLARAIVELKAEARAAGLSNADIDAELAAYNAERRDRSTE
jgi:hypothetical protein